MRKMKQPEVHLRESKTNMRQPIKKYKMFIYKLNKAIEESESDLALNLLDINDENVREVISLRNGTRRREYRKLLREKKSIGIAASYQGRIIGYGWGKYVGAFDNFYKVNVDGYIAGIFVSRDFRGHNVAPLIVSELVRKMKLNGVEDFYTSIQTENFASQHAFKKLGVEKIKEVEMYRMFKMTVPKRNIL